MVLVYYKLNSAIAFESVWNQEGVLYEKVKKRFEQPWGCIVFDHALRGRR
jgi:hypothetical protein